jgi:hypothetical protein
MGAPPPHKQCLYIQSFEKGLFGGASGVLFYGTEAGQGVTCYFFSDYSAVDKGQQPRENEPSSDE